VREDDALRGQLVHAGRLVELAAEEAAIGPAPVVDIEEDDGRARWLGCIAMDHRAGEQDDCDAQEVEEMSRHGISGEAPFSM